MSNDFRYKEITWAIIGASMKVHSYLGPGFPEKIFHRSLVVQCNKDKIEIESEVEKKIYFEGVFIGSRRLDLLAEGKVLVEIKAMRELQDWCYAQVINYLKVFNIEVGLLINFGAQSLQYKRFSNTKNLRNP